MQYIRKTLRTTLIRLVVTLKVRWLNHQYQQLYADANIDSILVESHQGLKDQEEMRHTHLWLNSDPPPALIRHLCHWFSIDAGSGTGH